MASRKYNRRIERIAVEILIQGAVVRFYTDISFYTFLHIALHFQVPSKHT